MEIAEYENIYKNESSHFLYTSRHKIIINLVRKYFRKSHALKILDAGCGTGLFAKKLAKFGDVTGIDISSRALKFAQKRGIKTKKASVIKLPFKENYFNLLVSIDVLYHRAVEDDVKALKEFFRVLKPNGLLIIRLPANKWIKTIHDQHVHTRQRYDKVELRNKLIKVGFAIEKLYFVDGLLLPISLLQSLWQKVVPAKTTESAVKPLPKLINNMLAYLLSQDVEWPFGIGLIAVGRKPLRHKITPSKKTS
ncbi:class I SAM-dependent methyltransferase [Candidatus Microgenomates bacterium]|nr:class I SAM-dependent methyltransferase [Candidatus Microgenomates bacterium]